MSDQIRSRGHVGSSISPRCPYVAGRLSSPCRQATEHHVRPRTWQGRAEPEPYGQVGRRLYIVIAERPVLVLGGTLQVMCSAITSEARLEKPKPND